MGEADGELQLAGNLPEVVTEAKLVDLSANALEVAVEEKPYLQVPFERAIDEDAARAKFVKKAKELHTCRRERKRVVREVMCVAIFCSIYHLNLRIYRLTMHHAILQHIRLLLER